jgi:hypothetical protein
MKQKPSSPSAADDHQPRLLSGGNPQIPKGEGDGPVQAYIRAMPGWKQQMGLELDAMIVANVPAIQKAVKWNSPFYGMEGQGWFISFHVFTHYLKVTFFHGTQLEPLPPGGTAKSGEARWIDLHEGVDISTTPLESWIRQAAALPGWKP